jgi:hypothetical protein
MTKQVWPRATIKDSDPVRVWAAQNTHSSFDACPAAPVT